MVNLCFSTPVCVLVKQDIRRTVSRVDEAAEVLLYDFPKSSQDDSIVKAAMKASRDVMMGKGAVENARSIFEAAAREVGLLAD
ncbi:DUF982 domain-containing protein [Microvirga brassicacearum]|uniref:DUF982 domain-containing protein n=1 Tax=Microvirga brassicacearum TaxID=2580413 RepID=A0A5N3PAU8_9HYPH|nr:DUF982 domain-containing protein [Microvirga brassicacearum]